MYGTSYYSSSYSTAGAGIVGAALIILLVCSLGGYALSSFLLSRIFKKAGQKTSIAWIPIYNMWKFLELGDQKGFWIFVPGAGTIFMYIAMYHIGKKLGKDDVFVALAIFVPVIWLIILGFDKSVWNGVPAAVATAAPVIEEAPVYTAPVAPEQPAYAAPEQPAYSAPVVETPAVETPAPAVAQPVMAPTEPAAAQPDYTIPTPAATEAPVVDTAATSQNTEIQ